RGRSRKVVGGNEGFSRFSEWLKRLPNMNVNSRSRAPLSSRSFTMLLIAGLTVSSQAGGPQGVDVGCVIDNSGNPILTSAACTKLVQGKTGYIRMEFRLVNGNTTWNSTMLAYYD